MSDKPAKVRVRRAAVKAHPPGEVVRQAILDSAAILKRGGSLHVNWSAWRCASCTARWETASTREPEKCPACGGTTFGNRGRGSISVGSATITVEGEGR